MDEAASHSFDPSLAIATKLPRQFFIPCPRFQVTNWIHP